MKFDDGAGSEEERKSRLSGLPQAAQASNLHENEAITSRPLFPLKPVRQVDIFSQPLEICG